MAHSHDHNHDASAYFTEQLCTLGICGVFGAIAVALYATGGLNVLLAQGILRHSVLAGGIALLVLVLVRAVTLWFAVGKPVPAHVHDHDDDCCDHDHDHEHAIAERPLSPGSAFHHHHEHAISEQPLMGAAMAHHHDHDHSHGHGHDHSHGGHDHSHDHGWAPIRYVVLLIPVMLYFLVGLEALTASGVESFDPNVSFPTSKGFMGTLGFRELDVAKDSESGRKYYEGKVAQITGMLVPSPSDRWFTLQRLKIRCCAADAVPLNAVVLIDESQVKDLPPEERSLNFQALNRKWVEVTAQIQFQQGPNGWMAVLVVRPTPEMPITKLIRQIPPDPDPYL
jgi:hypothetical protein